LRHFLARQKGVSPDLSTSESGARLIAGGHRLREVV
jgi:hypothetical protein